MAIFSSHNHIMIYQVAMQEVNLVTIKDIAKARDMKYGDALEGQVIGLS